MSWKFAGINFKTDYRGSYPDLLKRLGVEFHQSGEGFTFSDAISRDNQATALGFVNGSTMLLHHFLPYDCSYEPGEEGQLDDALEALSLEGAIMNYIIDGVSGTYCFSVFSGGKRIRRWAVEPGKVLCNEGEPVAGESATITRNPSIDDSLPDIFAMSEDEAHIFAVWEAFLGVSFQELVKSEAGIFEFFL
jgi:hypothetical protein